MSWERVITGHAWEFKVWKKLMRWEWRWHIITYIIILVLLISILLQFIIDWSFQFISLNLLVQRTKQSALLIFLSSNHFFIFFSVLIIIFYIIMLIFLRWFYSFKIIGLIVQKYSYVLVLHLFVASIKFLCISSICMMAFLWCR